MFHIAPTWKCVYSYKFVYKNGFSTSSKSPPHTELSIIYDLSQHSCQIWFSYLLSKFPLFLSYVIFFKTPTTADSFLPNGKLSWHLLTGFPFHREVQGQYHIYKHQHKNYKKKIINLPLEINRWKKGQIVYQKLTTMQKKRGKKSDV